jgi:hypothetical protein
MYGDRKLSANDVRLKQEEHDRAQDAVSILNYLKLHNTNN